MTDSMILILAEKLKHAARVAARLNLPATGWCYGRRESDVRHWPDGWRVLASKSAPAELVERARARGLTVEPAHA